MPDSPAPPQLSAPKRQRQVRLTPEQIAKFIADYKAGASVADLSRRYGVNVKTATAHLTRAGVTIRRQHGIPADLLDEAQQLHAQGWTVVALGKRYGCSRTTVANQLKLSPDARLASVDPGLPG